MISWFFRGLYDFRLVLKQLIWQQLTLRYRRTALGFLWTLLNPLLTMAVTSVVFSMIMRWPLKSFAVFLFSGLVPWTFFSNTLSQGMQSLLINEGLIKKVFIPRQIFVVSVSVSLIIDAVISTFCLFLIAIFIGAPLTWSLLSLVINFILLFLFSLGITLILSVATVYFRDVPNIVGVVLQAGYYLTPIIYPLSFVPDQYKWIFWLNPMMYFIDIFRDPLYNGILPSVVNCFIAAFMAMVSFFYGVYVFKKYDRFVVFKM